MKKIFSPWLYQYRRDQLAGDISAGIIVTLMLIPQGMAYAIVAGLPPVTGLYASILPVFAYALLGSSMVQSVGPMAITSLMTGTALALLAPGNPGQALPLAALLALIAGAVLLLCGALKLGYLANFLSRPVMSGFTTGAALLIGLGQLRMLCGLTGQAPLGQALDGSHTVSIVVGLASLAGLWSCKQWLSPLLRHIGVSPRAADVGGKLGPVLVLLIATALCAANAPIRAAIAMVGNIPSGLPMLSVSGLTASINTIPALGTPATLIAFMIFLSSQSAALTLALKRNERIDSNRELFGLGAANVAAAVSGGFPVTGSISRSAVNYSAGANTPLASVITASLLALLLVLPPGSLDFLAFMPLPTLAAMILMAVVSMIDTDILRTAWRHDRSDALALLVTVISVVVLGVEKGVILGVVLSFATLIGRSSKPHIAVLGRIAGTEHFRNVSRHVVDTLPHAVFVRIDAALMFGNTQSVVDRLERELAGQPAARHLVLVMSAVNGIDTSGLYMLLELNRQLQTQGIRLHLSEVKGPVMDSLKTSGLLLEQLSGSIYLSTQEAFTTLANA